MLLHVSPVWSSLRGTVSDTSSGEAILVASPVSSPLFWVVLCPRTGGVCNRSVCRLSRSCGYLFRGSHHGGLPGIDTSSGEAIMVASPVSSCGLFSRLTGTVGHTLFKRALMGAPWVCPLILNGPSGIVPRGPHTFQVKASVHLDVSESAPGD